MPNPLDQLPKLPTEAMGPCVLCNRQLLESGLPIFFRAQVQQCGIDARAVDERVGLATMMGGRSSISHLMPFADIMASKPPVVVMARVQEFNVCHDCATKDASALGMLFWIQQAREGHERRRSTDEVAA